MSAEGEEEFFRRRGFGARMGFGKAPALLIVDFILAFTDPQRVLGANVDSQIEATNLLLKRARDLSMPVLFSTIAYDEHELRDVGLWGLKMKGFNTLKAGTDGVSLDPRLDVRQGDVIIVKKYASCFFGTDIVSRLLLRGVDTLVIAGCTTSGCVRATVVDAIQTGFRPMIVREAVGDRSAAAHDQSLFDMNAKYGDVISLQEALACMI
jgi:maleamate amidohydrolase